MTIDLTRRYAAGERLPTGPEWFELQRLVAKHRTATPSDAAYTAEAVNAALDAEQAEQDLPPSEAADIVAERAHRFYRQVPAGGPVDWSDPDPANRLQATVDDVRARREADAAAFVERWARPALPVLPLDYVQRVDALAMAATVYQGRAHDVGTDAVLETAADFEAYLRGDEVPTPVVVPPRLQPVEDVPPPLVAVNGSGVWRVAGYTFADLRDLDADAAERLAVHLDAALAEDRVDRGTRPLVRTALAILRRQR